MKIAIAQTRPFRGDIPRNVAIHRRYAEAAAAQKASLIVFPELSLTGYEPTLARDLATGVDDRRLRELQYVCDRNAITLAAGLPTPSERGVHVSMIIFQPGMARLVYSKQLLHTDETPYFVPGTAQCIFSVKGMKISPAICYESTIPDHAHQAAIAGAQIYLASVAKPYNGVEKTRVHYPAIAKAYDMMVVMSNCVGPCDNFVATGCSAVYARDGSLLAQLGETEEGMLIVDTDNNSAAAYNRDMLEVPVEIS